jgi:hypothetical protein
MCTKDLTKDKQQVMIKISKPLTKQTELTHKGKTVTITLTPQGDLIFKPKHSRSDFKTTVEEVFSSLTNGGSPTKDEPKPTKRQKMVSLDHLRQMNAVMDLPYKVKVKFEEVIMQAYKENK